MLLSRSLRAAVCLTFALALGGCAFQPLYGDRGGRGETALALQNVEITAPDSRLGLLMRNELIFLTGSADGGSVYTLNIIPSASEVALFSNTVGRVTSYSYRLTANWQLTSKETGDILTSGRSERAASYNRTDQPFANIRAQRDAEERAATLVAEDISTRVAAYFATTAPAPVQ